MGSVDVTQMITITTEKLNLEISQMCAIIIK